MTSVLFIRLESAQLDELAARVADVLAGREARDPLVDAEACAAFLNVEREWVYEHAVELGGKRLGGGPRGRLRFDLDEVLRRLESWSIDRGSGAASAPAVEPRTRPRRRSAMGTEVELLPIRTPGGARG